MNKDEIKAAIEEALSHFVAEPNTEEVRDRIANSLKQTLPQFGEREWTVICDETNNNLTVDMSMNAFHLNAILSPNELKNGA